MAEDKRPDTSELLAWCFALSADVARGVRFVDSEARGHCTREAALHLYRQLPRFDAARGVPMAAYAGLICRRRLMRLAQSELRARLHCRVRAIRPHRSRPRPKAEPICCPRCRAAVGREIDRQIGECRRSDAEYATWTRDLLLGQRRILVGDARPRK